MTGLAVHPNMSAPQWKGCLLLMIEVQGLKKTRPALSLMTATTVLIPALRWSVGSLRCMTAAAPATESPKRCSSAGPLAIVAAFAVKLTMLAIQNKSCCTLM